MTTQPTTSIETPVILLTTPLEYGRQKAKECGRKRISDEMAMRYAEPCYYWEVRDLLEKKSFDSMKNLFSFFYSLYLLANNKTAKSALCCGFVYSAEKREHSNSPYFFKSDADFQNLYKMDAININKIEAIIDYFTSQPIEPTLDELKAQYLAMPLDDLRRIKKEKYSNMDITTAMSNDEKAITEAIAIKFSELNQKIKEKRQAKKAAANQEPTNQDETMQPQPTQPQNENPAIAKIVNYTQDRIDNWYSNVKEEYGITGNAQVSYHEPTDAFMIKGVEKGKKTYFSISCRDGVPSIDYVFNVWMEEFKVVENSQPEPLTVGQTIQGENCRLIVTAVKEAKKANNEVEPTINRLKENISRLEKTIESGAFQKGYIENCKKDIDSYKTQIEKLLSQQAEIQPTQEPENKPTQEPSNEPIKSMTENPATAATYAKYCPNVFVAKCDQQHEKGSIIEIETKYGKIHEVIVFNLIHQKNGFFYYSIVRADGYNVQERAKQKAARYEQWANSADKKSTQYYEASNEGRDFLSLGEPIKVGHHSEKKHRALIERNWERMGKSVEMSKKADFHSEKAAYWADKADTINLSMPESLEYFEFKLEQAKKEHEGLKNGTIQRSHSFSLTYAKKAVNELEDKVKTAYKLWA